MVQIKSLLLAFVVLCIVPALGTDDAATTKIQAHRKRPHSGAHHPPKRAVETPLKQEDAQTLFTKYHESYITKEAARKLKNKLRTTKKRPITDEDYDELVQGIIFKSKQKSMPHYQEKKYFDDLPSGEDELEDIPESQDSKDDLKRVTGKGKKRFNHRVARDVKEEENKNSKRSAYLQLPPTFYVPRRQVSSYYYQVQGQPAVGYQPVYFNVPHPPQNPAGTTIQPTKRPDPLIGNRFGEDDDRPVWDIVQNNIKNQPTPLESNSVTGFPTRRPSQQATTRRPSPPLFHESDVEEDLQTILEQWGIRPPSAGASANAPEQFTQRPAVQQFPVVTSRPQTTRPNVQTTRGLSRCVWAIVNCCSRNNADIRYACFEAVGCHGAFWDLNPCSEELLDAAIDESDSYFQ